VLYSLRRDPHLNFAFGTLNLRKSKRARISEAMVSVVVSTSVLAALSVQMNTAEFGDHLPQNT
jgi:hypothetical protein